MPATGTVTLTGPLPAGVTLAAQSDNPVATAGPVTFPAASPTVGTFPVTTKGVRAVTQPTLTVSGGAGISAAAKLTIQGGLFNLALDAPSIIVGQSAGGRISLSCPSLDPTVINLSSSNPAAAQLSATQLTIPPGQTDATFSVTGTAVDLHVTITAAQDGLPPQTAILQIKDVPPKNEAKEQHPEKSHPEKSDPDKRGVHTDGALAEPPFIAGFPTFPEEEDDLVSVVRLLALRLVELEERVAGVRPFLRAEERPPVGLAALDDSDSGPGPLLGPDGDGDGRR
jgi:hypothetical protein